MSILVQLEIEGGNHKRSQKRENPKSMYKLPLNPWLTAELNMHGRDLKWPSEEL